jgi:hypothetical protein
MIKRFVVCCATATVTFAPMSAQSQSFEHGLEIYQQSVNNLTTNAMNGIGLQNTLPPSKRAPSYSNRSVTGRGGSTKPYDFSGSTASRNLNYTGDFAKYARAANMPARDPSSSMAMWMALGWSIANGVELSEKNPSHVEGVRRLQRQAQTTMRQNTDINDANNRQLIDEQLRKNIIQLDSLRVAIRNRQDSGELAELSDSVHSAWQRKFGIDLRSVILTEDGLVNR